MLVAYADAYVDANVAHFTAFLCFVFCFAYAYVASEKPIFQEVFKKVAKLIYLSVQHLKRSKVSINYLLIFYFAYVYKGFCFTALSCFTPIYHEIHE